MCLVDETLTGTTSQNQSWPENNGMKEYSTFPKF